jgi:hypothetical protein
MPGKYNVVRLSAATLPDVEALYTAVYAKTPPAGFFTCKYNTTFTGVEHTGFLAYDGQLPVAFYAVIPCFIKADGNIILSAQSADTMTHPDYRNQGLFIELALHTFQLCEECGIKLIFGFPNQNSLPGFVNKLGWRRTENLDCFIIPTGNFSWDRFFNKFSITKKLYKRYQQVLLKKYALPGKGIANSVLEDGFGGVHRDESYLQYKTYNNTYALKLNKALLWVKVGSIFLIGDMNVIPGDFNNTMKQVKKLAWLLGIKQIHFHASPGTTLHALFAGRFNSITSFPVIFKVLEDGTSNHKIKFTSADIDTF